MLRPCPSAAKLIHQNEKFSTNVEKLHKAIRTEEMHRADGHGKIGTGRKFILPPVFQQLVPTDLDCAKAITNATETELSSNEQSLARDLKITWKFCVF